MFEYIVLGIIQGIGEWLPVSSEGLIVLTKTNFFPAEGGVDAIIHQALFLHFGTFLAALIYFHKDVFILLKTFTQYKQQSDETKKLFSFLFISTLISGALGLILIKLLSHFSEHFESKGKIITLLVGCLLLITAYLEIKSSKENKNISKEGRSNYRQFKDISIIDGIVLGIVQGFAALPGLSRSGLTVSTLLLRKFDKPYALKMSFLMSLPIVLAGNIILNLDSLYFSLSALAGLFFSFIFGLITVHLLLKIAQKVNFGYFVLTFGIISIFSALL